MAPKQQKQQKQQNPALPPARNKHENHKSDKAIFLFIISSISMPILSFTDSCYGVELWDG